jgi:hypothetical protein
VPSRKSSTTAEKLLMFTSVLRLKRNIFFVKKFHQICLFIGYHVRNKACYCQMPLFCIIFEFDIGEQSKAFSYSIPNPTQQLRKTLTLRSIYQFHIFFKKKIDTKQRHLTQQNLLLPCYSTNKFGEIFDKENISFEPQNRGNA